MAYVLDEAAKAVSLSKTVIISKAMKLLISYPKTKLLLTIQELKY